MIQDMVQEPEQDYRGVWRRGYVLYYQAHRAWETALNYGTPGTADFERAERTWRIAEIAWEDTQKVFLAASRSQYKAPMMAALARGRA